MCDAHEVVSEDHLRDGDTQARGHGVDGAGFEDGEFERGDGEAALGVGALGGGGGWVGVGMGALLAHFFGREGMWPRWMGVEGYLKGWEVNIDYLWKVIAAAPWAKADCDTGKSWNLRGLQSDGLLAWLAGLLVVWQVVRY